MVKFGKNKLKTLNKGFKKQKDLNNVSTKIVKKKVNMEENLLYPKESFLKELVSGNNSLVKHVSAKEIVINDSAKKKKKKVKIQESIQKPKIKVIQKQKQRQKTQLSDTKLLLSLMKKK